MTGNGDNFIQLARVGRLRSTSDDHLHRATESRHFESVHRILDGHDMLLRDGQRATADSEAVEICVQSCPSGVHEACAEPFTVSGSDRD